MTFNSSEFEALAKRVTELEDIKAIEQLKYTYAGYCDDNYNPEGIASLFTEDGRWVVDGEGGAMVGHEEIKAHFKALSAHIPWALHFMIAPKIEIAADGIHATGTFYLLCHCTIGQSNDPSQHDAVVLTLNYRDKFVKRDGVWLFEELIGSTHQVSNWDQGWVKQQFR